MSIIPVEVPTGAIRYNTDSNKMECFNGTKWYEISVSSPDLNGGARGLFQGGSVPSPGDGTTTVDYITIPTTGNAIDFGDLTGNCFSGSGGASRTRSINANGWRGSNSNIIDYGTIPSLGNYIDFGDSTYSSRYPTGFSNATRQITAGGYISGSDGTDTMDYITISTTGNAVDFGNLISGHDYNMAGSASPTRGFIFGSDEGNSDYINTIQYVTIATTGNAEDWGDLTTKGGKGRACSSPTRTLVGGGTNSGTAISEIQYITNSSKGNAIVFGHLQSDQRDLNGAVTDCVRACFGGGAPAYSTEISYTQITTGGDTADFGDLTVGRSYGNGVSNAHGGL